MNTKTFAIFFVFVYTISNKTTRKKEKNFMKKWFKKVGGGGYFVLK